MTNLPMLTNLPEYMIVSKAKAFQRCLQLGDFCVCSK